MEELLNEFLELDKKRIENKTGLSEPVFLANVDGDKKSFVIKGAVSDGRLQEITENAFEVLYAGHYVLKYGNLSDFKKYLNRHYSKEKVEKYKQLKHFGKG